MRVNILSLAFLASLLFFVSCNQTPENTPNNDSLALHGYAGNQMEKWDFGQQSAADVWLQWGQYLTDENLEGILSLAGDSIKIEVGENNEINGKAELAQRVGAWFETADVNFIPEWVFRLFTTNHPRLQGMALGS